MAKVNFTETINASLEWTATMLFRPFRIKKWLILTFIAFMAGSLFASCNANIPGNNGKKKTDSAETAGLQSAAKPQNQSSPVQDKDKSINPLGSFFLVTGVILLGLTILILFFWLYSRFSFVFLENLARNDASIKIPFKSNREIGNSFFALNLVFSLIFLVLAGAFIFLFLLLKSSLFGIIAWIILLLIALFTVVIITVIIRDFTLVIMFRDRSNFVPAFRKSIEIISSAKKIFLKYLFILIGMGIASNFISTLAILAAFIGLLFPAALLTGLFYLISLIIPAGLKSAYILVVMIVIATPLALAVVIFLNCLTLPFAVFFRTLNLKFIARLAPEYNLFTAQKESAL